MFRYTKRVLSLIFASVLLFNLLQTNVYAEDAAGTKEKVSCNATLEDEFADNRVMVVLDNETSLAVDEFSTSMFSGISYKKVQSLTTAKEAKVQEKMSAITAELNEVAVARNAAEIVTTENVMKIAATDEYTQSIQTRTERTDMKKKYNILIILSLCGVLIALGIKSTSFKFPKAVKAEIEEALLFTYEREMDIDYFDYYGTYNGVVVFLAMERFLRL